MPATITTEPQLYRLLAWFSPAMPVGAYSYSHGLEHAVDAGLVRDAATLRAFIETALCHGAGRMDAAWLVAAHRACLGRGWDGWSLERVLASAAAMRPTRELALESAQGPARRAARGVARARAGPARRDVRSAEGRVALRRGRGRRRGGPWARARPVAVAFLHGFSANLISAGVRLIPLGQTEGQRLTAALEPVVREIAGAAVATAPDEIGSAAPMIDLCSIAHETQYTRLFRS
jgi:urease accessory protein